MGAKRSLSIAGVLLAVVVLGVWSVRASGQAAPAAPAHQQCGAVKTVGVGGDDDPRRRQAARAAQAGEFAAAAVWPRDPLPRPPQVVAVGLSVCRRASGNPELRAVLLRLRSHGAQGQRRLLRQVACGQRRRRAVGAARHRMSGVHRRRASRPCRCTRRERRFATSAPRSRRSTRATYQNHTPTPPPPPAKSSSIDEVARPAQGRASTRHAADVGTSEMNDRWGGGGVSAAGRIRHVAGVRHEGTDAGAA